MHDLATTLSRPYFGLRRSGALQPKHAGCKQVGCITGPYHSREYVQEQGRDFIYSWPSAWWSPSFLGLISALCQWWWETERDYTHSSGINKTHTLSSIYIYVNVIKHVDITGAHHVEAASNVYIFLSRCTCISKYIYIYACVRMNTDFETCRHVCSYTMQTHTRVHFEMHV